MNHKTPERDVPMSRIENTQKLHFKCYQKFYNGLALEVNDYLEACMFSRARGYLDCAFVYLGLTNDDYIKLLDLCDTAEAELYKWNKPPRKGVKYLPGGIKMNVIRRPLVYQFLHAYNIMLRASKEEDFMVVFYVLKTVNFFTIKELDIIERYIRTRKWGKNYGFYNTSFS